MHDDGRLCTSRFSLSWAAAGLGTRIISDSIGSLLTCSPCSISSMGACDWWRTSELVAKAADGRRLRAGAAIGSWQRAARSSQLGQANTINH